MAEDTPIWLFIISPAAEIAAIMQFTIKPIINPKEKVKIIPSKSEVLSGIGVGFKIMHKITVIISAN